MLSELTFVLQVRAIRSGHHRTAPNRIVTRIPGTHSLRNSAERRGLGLGLARDADPEPRPQSQSVRTV